MVAENILTKYKLLPKSKNNRFEWYDKIKMSNFFVASLKRWIKTIKIMLKKNKHLLHTAYHRIIYFYIVIKYIQRNKQDR